MLMTTGEEAVTSKSGLITTIASKLDGRLSMPWKAGLYRRRCHTVAARRAKIIDDAPDSGALRYESAPYRWRLCSCLHLPGRPFTGICTPGSWVQDAQHQSPAHLIRATRWSLLLLPDHPMLDAMEKDSGFSLKTPARRRRRLAPTVSHAIQADILTPMGAPRIIETTRARLIWRYWRWATGNRKILLQINSGWMLLCCRICRRKNGAAYAGELAESRQTAMDWEKEEENIFTLGWVKSYELFNCLGLRVCSVHGLTQGYLVYGVRANAVLGCTVQGAATI